MSDPYGSARPRHATSLYERDDGSPAQRREQEERYHRDVAAMRAWAERAIACIDALEARGACPAELSELRREWQ
jgi:hypothetical protein